VSDNNDGVYMAFFVPHQGGEVNQCVSMENRLRETLIVLYSHSHDCTASPVK